MITAVLFLAGCATTRQASQPDAVWQTKIKDLETRLQEQEKEILDLRYELKDQSVTEEASGTVTESSSSSVKPFKQKDSVPAGFDVIKVAVSGADLQTALKGAGVYQGSIDGKVGAKTRAAIVEFQRSHNLKADGVVGQKTWNELKQYLND